MAPGWDVAIVGGGPAGAAAAIGLARAGRKVALLEKSAYNPWRIGETLPPIAQVPLMKLGAWEAFVQAGHAPSPGTQSAWGHAHLNETHFIFSAHGHGWHLDRPRFDAMLADTAARAGARVWQNARVITCDPHPHDGWRLEFTTGASTQRLQAAFVIDATGRASALARRQGSRRIILDRLVGLVRFFRFISPSHVDDFRTLIEATEDGWWYTASLPQSRLAVAYMTDADLKPSDRTALRAYWHARLERAPHTWGRVRQALPETEPRIVAAHTSHMQPMVGNAWLAVGDAATAYDPLSSLGIYNALESGLQAAQALASREPGNPPGVEAFERWTRSNFDEYMRMRALHYGREQRWPASRFWRRRQPVPEPSLKPVSRGSFASGAGS